MNMEIIYFGMARIQMLPLKAAWKMDCVPKDEGGFGVLDLKTQNYALVMKNLYNSLI